MSEKSADFITVIENPFEEAKAQNTEKPHSKLVRVYLQEARDNTILDFDRIQQKITA